MQDITDEVTINAPIAQLWKAIQDAGASRVQAISQFRPKGPVVRVMMPAIRRKFHQTQRAILDGLRQHAEH